MRWRWDIFCRVVDNFGDVGVCWRLAAELAARGHLVRLVIDDPSALTWLAPHGADGVSVVSWADADREAADASTRATADVLIEAFGCTLPASVSNRVFTALRPPVWINLEYLTAERFAEAAHGLASPQFDAAKRRVDKWFFFPGFSESSGGLVREAAFSTRRAAFLPSAWLAGLGIGRRAEERVVSLFCYENDAFDGLLSALSAADAAPTLVLATAGHAARQITERLGASMQRGALRAIALPWLTQTEYDHLLWASHVNFVRGEDSFVRAQWAGVPFVWQAYPQHDGAHHAKVDAFLACATPPADVAALFDAWNGVGLAPNAALAWPDEARWRDHASAWQRQLAAQPDLVTRLIDFVAARR